jgi:membrane-associated phospholipid phosphatase
MFKKGLFLSIFYFVFAVILWVVPYFRSFIYFCDHKAAYFFNECISAHLFFQNMWAFFNTRIFDVVHDFVMLAFILPYIFFSKKKSKKERFLEIVVLIFFSVVCAMFWNRLMVQKIFHLGRMSPLAVLPNLVNINDLISWTKIRNVSCASFPGDHGSTVFMFVISMFHLVGYRRAALALLFSIPVLLARLVVSGHWLSDIVLGSIPLALFNLGWLFYTPLFRGVINKLNFSIKRSIAPAK